VPGFGVVDGGFHGLQVADFPDEDHIGGLAQGVLQGAGIPVGVDAHLPLGDDGHFVVVDELDGVFDGHDIARWR